MLPGDGDTLVLLSGLASLHDKLRHKQKLSNISRHGLRSHIMLLVPHSISQSKSQSQVTIKESRNSIFLSKRSNKARLYKAVPTGVEGL